MIPGFWHPYWPLRLRPGKQHNAALLAVWADSQETETFFRSNFTLRMDVLQHNFIRFSGVADDNLTVCPAMIAPPRGIDHI